MTMSPDDPLAKAHKKSARIKNSSPAEM